MPLLLGNKEDDIMRWRASAQLAATLKESLAGKWACSSGREAESLLGKFIYALQDEIDQEAKCLRELSELDKALDAALSLERLASLQAGFLEIVSAHFQSRQSVLAFCGACGNWHDRLLAKAVSLSEERPAPPGPGGRPVYALLVAGAGGRGELTPGDENRYLLLHRGPSPEFAAFADRLSAALRDTGLLKREQLFWQGTLQQYRCWLEANGESVEQKEPPAPLPFEAPMRSGPQKMPEGHWRLEAIMDLRLLQGDADLASRALAAAELALRQERRREQFQQLSRRILGLPLAVGRFGRWRLQGSGEHRGKLNLDEFALGPLVMTVRVLAAHAEICGGGTVDRIGALLAQGGLDVELAERLLKAYQCFMQLKIRYRIGRPGSSVYCDPAAFEEAEEARFRNGIAAVLNLQKIGYQRMVGQG